MSFGAEMLSIFLQCLHGNEGSCANFKKKSLFLFPFTYPDFLKPSCNATGL